MATQPFIWGQGGQKLTPAQAKAMRDVAAALAARKDTPQNLGEGLSSVGDALLYNANMARAGEAESAGAQRVAEALAEARASGNPNAFLDVMGNEWASPGQQLIAGELYKGSKPDWQTFESGGDILRYNQNDPNSQPSVFYDGPDPEAVRPMTQEERTAWGIPANDPTPYAIGADNLPKPIGGGKGQTINVGGNNDIGTIPPGKMVQRDEAGNVIGMVDIPGGPSALEAEAAAAKTDLASGRKDTATDTITTAAGIARELSSKPGNAGIVGAVMANLSETEAAEMRRQVDVLKAQATIENLTAMRQASPTGGALGSVTEKEGAMLASAAGAVDPNAKPADFQRALDNYERTLLRIVHGPSEGDRIFEETRSTATPPGGAAKIKDDADYDALPSGATFIAPDGTTRKKP
jgi:hypothetical protein